MPGFLNIQRTSNGVTNTMLNQIFKGIRHPNKALRALTYRVLCNFGSYDYKRFIVVTRSRTGSNLLISFLSSHPNVRAQWEIFNKLNGRSYKDILTSAFDKQPYYIRASGFKIFYYHPEDAQDREYPDIWQSLRNMKDLKIIHLKRRNILRTLISRKIAEYDNIY